MSESDQVEAGKEPRKQSMLYELCSVCGGSGCEHAKTLCVMETGATARQLRYMAQLDTLRQKAGISAASASTRPASQRASRAAWQPIETAPRDGKIVLLFGRDADGDNWKMKTGSWNRFENQWYWDGRTIKGYDIQPSHWQPLPEPPEKQG